jgi:hypothetical protein
MAASIAGKISFPARNHWQTECGSVGIGMQARSSGGIFNQDGTAEYF